MFYVLTFIALSCFSILCLYDLYDDVDDFLDLMISLQYCIALSFLTYTARIDYLHPLLLLLNSALRVTQRYTPSQSESIFALNTAVYLSF